MTKFIFRFKGGEGSGHYDHKGRPGKQGGSLPGKSDNSNSESSDDLDTRSKAAIASLKTFAEKNGWKFKPTKFADQMSTSMEKYTSRGNKMVVRSMAGGGFSVPKGANSESSSDLEGAVKIAENYGKWMDKKDEEAGVNRAEEREAFYAKISKPPYTERQLENLSHHDFLKFGRTDSPQYGVHGQEVSLKKTKAVDAVYEWVKTNLDVFSPLHKMDAKSWMDTVDNLRDRRDSYGGDSEMMGSSDIRGFSDNLETIKKYMKAVAARK